MGALIGFELARRLRRERAPQPRHLFVSGSAAPQLERTREPIHTLDEPAFVQELRRLGGTPPEVFEHRELFELMQAILRADFAVFETYDYAPEPPLGCDLTAFGGSDDPEVSAGELRAWGEQTAGRFAAHTLPGDHFFMHTAERQLLAALSSELQIISDAAP
jgi:medium-chain acyl-[acyl-carrier-protein] hydrolase